MQRLRDSFVLVTGGRGFIGRAVTKLLQRSEHRVISLDQSEAMHAGASEEQSLQQVICDITDMAQLSRVFAAQPVGAIIHLAAVLPTAAQRNPVRATQVNVQGSLNLLEIARRFAVDRFVFGSSLSVYGTWQSDSAVSESDRAAAEDLYGATKLYVEQLGSAYRNSHGMDFVSLRIGRVVGPGAESETSAWRSQIFELPGTTQPADISLPYAASERLLVVHVDDVAKMLVMLAEAPSLNHTIYNAPCESISVSDLKRGIESLDVKINLKLGEQKALGNPQVLDSSRFENEFRLRTVPILEQLRLAAAKSS